MINFCTLFDSYYIHKGIALYKSLEKVSSNFHLYVMAFDKECFEKLNSFNFKHMTIECWENYETGRIADIKQERTKAEYCWSCGPSVIHHFITKHKLESITYLDSDLYFVSDPQIVFDEIGNKSIAITEQGISESSAKLYGRFCVQFMFFKNDADGIKALSWWEESCLDWCYQRFEDGKYADQKYIDQFPVMFNNVHIIKNLGVGIAPWNIHRYKFEGTSIHSDSHIYDAVFIHMHGFKFEINDNTMTLTSFDYSVTENDRQMFYNEYAELVMTILNDCFNKHIISYQVEGIKGLKKINYAIRNSLRGLKLVQWLYFKVINIKYKGHGSSIIN